jgi:hypothetical protein
MLPGGVGLRSLRGAEYLGCLTISARQPALRLVAVLKTYLGPADWDAQPRARVGCPSLRDRSGRGQQWVWEWWQHVHHCQVPLGVAVALVAAAAALLHLATAGRPMAAILRLGRNSPEKLEVAAAVEVARSALPLADGQTRDPIGKVAVVDRPLGNAEVVLGDTVQGVVQGVVGHGACYGRGYPDAQREVVEHRPQVQRGAHLEVQELLHGERLLALPSRPQALGRCPIQVGDYMSPLTTPTRIAKWTDQVGQLCCRSSHERRQ